FRIVRAARRHPRRSTGRARGAPRTGPRCGGPHGVLIRDGRRDRGASPGSPAPPAGRRRPTRELPHRRSAPARPLRPRAWRARYVAHPSPTSTPPSLTLRTPSANRARVIQAERLKSLFLDLVQIDSLSRREGQIAERLARELKDLGASVVFDRAHEAVGGEV